MIRRWLYRRLFRDLVAEQVSVTLIRWREAGNLGQPDTEGEQHGE